MSRTSRAVALAAALVAAAASLPGAAQKTRDLAALTKDEWRQDLRYFARELPRRHKNAFHFTTREQFDRAVADLDAAVPSLEAHQIVVRLQGIAATIGDGHTGVHLPESFKLYPVALFWFGGELRVTGAAPAARSALGAKVLKINGVPIDEVAARVKRVVSQDENEWYVLATTPSFIMRPEVLHTLGVVPGVASATFTLEDDQGRPFDVDLTPFSQEPGSPPRFAGASAVQPVSRQHQEEAFWYVVLPDAQTLYVNFRRYTSLEDNARKLFEFMDANPRVTRLVIDLRQNGGGDFTKVRRSLLPGIKQRASINTKGRLFVLIGRRTFSAALANAVDFRKETNAILVGEPIGERPNSYSENDEMTLPNSRVVVSYSTRYYQFVEQDVPAVLPDQRIDVTWPDFKAGRDAALEWILAYKH
jgi:hypothetical protein